VKIVKDGIEVTVEITKTSESEKRLEIKNRLRNILDKKQEKIERQREYIHKLEQQNEDLKLRLARIKMVVNKEGTIYKN